MIEKMTEVETFIDLYKEIHTDKDVKTDGQDELSKMKNTFNILKDADKKVRLKLKKTNK